MGMMSAGLGLIGGVVQGMGAKQAADAQAAAHDYNAKVAERNIGVIRDQTWAAGADIAEKDQRTMYAIRGKFAANGVTLGGSALDVMMDTSNTLALNFSRVHYQGTIQTIEEIDKMNLEKMAADADRQAGNISMAAGILSGLTSMVNAMPSGG
jgi:hypothetical protein